MNDVDRKLQAALFPVKLSDIYLGRPAPGQGSLFDKEAQNFKWYLALKLSSL